MNNLEQFLTTFEKRLLEFELAGGYLQAEKKVQYLLRYLPESCDQCRDNILDRPKNEITLEYAKKHIRRRQLRLQELAGNRKNKPKEQESAYITTKKKANWKKKIKCFNFSKMGHFSYEC